MDATLVRMAHWKIDIKIVNGNDMHILQWRRHMSHDEVLLDGKVQQMVARCSSKAASSVIFGTRLIR